MARSLALRLAAGVRVTPSQKKSHLCPPCRDWPGDPVVAGARGRSARPRRPPSPYQTRIGGTGAAPGSRRRSPSLRREVPDRLCATGSRRPPRLPVQVATAHARCADMCGLRMVRASFWRDVLYCGHERGSAVLARRDAAKCPTPTVRSNTGQRDQVQSSLLQSNHTLGNWARRASGCILVARSRRRL
jgi:hypothetical protein